MSSFLPSTNPSVVLFIRLKTWETFRFRFSFARLLFLKCQRLIFAFNFKSVRSPSSFFSKSFDSLRSLKLSINKFRLFFEFFCLKTHWLCSGHRNHGRQKCLKVQIITKKFDENFNSSLETNFCFLFYCYHSAFFSKKKITATNIDITRSW